MAQATIPPSPIARIAASPETSWTDYWVTLNASQRREQLALWRDLLDQPGATEQMARAMLAATWPLRAHPAQLPPEGAWRSWLFMGGRGAGKTRAGAEWVRGEVEAGRAKRIALIAPTLSDVREVMIEGPSGLANVGFDSFRPTYEVSRRRLVWPGGFAEAHAFSAEDPDSLRGPQFDLCWCDEIGAWTHDSSTWNMMQFGLRLGDRPRILATTTPRPTPLVRRLVEDATCVVTHAPTSANARNLAPGFIDAISAMYGGGSLARQELEGELLLQEDGALFSRENVDAFRISPDRLPEMDRVVIGLDPAVSAGVGADATGIVCCGLAGDIVYVLEDASVQGASPTEWAERVAALARKWKAGLVVAEANQGGEMVRNTLGVAGVDRLARIELRRASESKYRRAGPVSVRYQKGMVRHVGRHRQLEDEMCAFTGAGGPSPDRMDALVWAASELFVQQPLPRMHVV